MKVEKVAKRDYNYDIFNKRFNHFTIGKVGDEVGGGLYLDKEKWPYHSLTITISSGPEEKVQEGVQEEFQFDDYEEEEYVNF